MNHEQKLESLLNSADLDIQPKTEPILTPEELEQKMIDSVNEKAEQVSPEDSATMMFGMYYPIFSNMVEKLSNKSLRRMIRAIIGEPLENTKMNLKIQAEKTAYAIAEQLLQAKFTLMLHTAVEAEKKKQEDSKKSTPEELVVDTTVTPELKD